mgnify:CR=1 FL=1
MNFDEIYFDNCYKSLKKLYSDLGSKLDKYEDNNNDENKRQIELLYDKIKGGDISESSSDDDDFYSEFFDIKQKDSNTDKFYNNIINNSINNDMIYRYNDERYLQLYKNYKDNFIF